MKEHRILIDNGENTEEVLQYIFNELSDAEIDLLTVERSYQEETSGYLGEPLTTAALLSLSGAALIGVIRIIERWLEHKKQEKQMHLVLEGFKQSDDAGRALAELAKNNNLISIEYKLSKKSDLE